MREKRMHPERPSSSTLALTFLAALSDQFISQITVARHLREACLQPLLGLHWGTFVSGLPDLCQVDLQTREELSCI